MKIIISHDVDHLYPSDHIFNDLIFPKLWFRSVVEFVNGKISFQTLSYRLISIFDKRINRIPEIIDFDIKYSIPSIFFFGMDNILGMSYNRNDATAWIQFVLEMGLDAGVHGVEYEDINKMLDEFISFQAISNLTSFGIRTHYVRYNNHTFQKMSSLGYLFDSSEFNKVYTEFRTPYKVGNMWEFPLHLMDGYIVRGDIEAAKKQTIKILEKAIKADTMYFTLLFHDYLFNEKTYPIEKAYYEWFVQYSISNNLVFISYREAIAELERKIRT